MTDLGVFFPNYEAVLNILSANLSQFGLNLPVYPVKLTVALTNRCNMRCKICNVWAVYRDNPSKVEEEMTLDQYCTLFSSLDNGRLLYLEFTGGEPFLRDDVDEIVVQAVKRIPSLLFCAITTNGFSPKSILRKVLTIYESVPTFRLVVGVSLDGTSLIHDELKGREGVWKSAVETFLELRDLSEKIPFLRPHLSYTINTFNAGGFEAFFQHMVDEFSIKISDVSLSVEHSGYLYQQKRVTRISYLKVLDDLNFYKKMKQRESNTSNSIVDRLRNFSYNFYIDGIMKYLVEPKPFNCAALKVSAFLDAYGDLFPCVLGGDRLGSIKTTSFDEIWFSDKKKRVLEHLEAGRCASCWTPCEVQPSLMLWRPILQRDKAELR